MSLRRKDDWDVLLEEAYWRAYERGDAVLLKPFIAPPGYDYAAGIAFRLVEILETDDGL